MTSSSSSLFNDASAPYGHQIVIVAICTEISRFHVRHNTWHLTPLILIGRKVKVSEIKFLKLNMFNLSKTELSWFQKFYFRNTRWHIGVIKMKISEIKFPKLNFSMYHTKNFGNFISEILFRKFLFLYVSCAVSEIKFRKLNFGN